MEEKPFEREVLDRLTTIETMMKSFSDSKSVTYQNQKDIILLHEKDANQQKELESMKEDNKWLKRQLVSTVIVCGVGLIFVYIKMGLGVQ